VHAARRRFGAQQVRGAICAAAAPSAIAAATPAAFAMPPAGFEALRDDRVGAVCSSILAAATLVE
jgi:hypothetical protein